MKLQVNILGHNSKRQDIFREISKLLSFIACFQCRVLKCYLDILLQSAKSFSEKTYLLALEESFSVAVGKIQRQSHYTRSVLHSLNDSIQFSPAWTLLE